MALPAGYGKMGESQGQRRAGWREARSQGRMVHRAGGVPRDRAPGNRGL